MQWWAFALLGAGGGALVEVLSVFNSIALWQGARRTPAGRVRARPPALRMYLDVPAHAWMFLFRTLLGAVAAFAFGVGGSISGMAPAVALGFSAPSFLAQLGSIPRLAQALTDTTGDASYLTSGSKTRNPDTGHQPLISPVAPQVVGEQEEASGR